MMFRGMEFKITSEHQNTNGFQVNINIHVGRKKFLKYQEKVEKSIHRCKNKSVFVLLYQKTQLK